MTRNRWTTGMAAAAALALAAPAARAVPIAPGYTVSEIALPDFAAGDVVVVGDALFVGAGPGFVGGAQSIVRIDAGGTTVVAQGFQGLGGIAYDAANDRLLVTDNALEAPYATTGDTVYAIAAPLGAFPVPVAALGSELLPAGALPGIGDIELDPADPSGQTLLATDSVANQVQRIALTSGSVTALHATSGYAAGLATDGATLWFGAVAYDAQFEPDGSVSAVALPGTGAASLLASGLPGQYDLELAGDGTLLATAGGSLVRIDPTTGATTTVATGFGFATGLFSAGGSIWVLDGGFPGTASVYRLTPVPAPAALPFLGAGLVLLVQRARRTS
ncbi:MAG: hypothetical protein OZ928_07550 [Polyangiaceae bacterium]|nr:hypothetical protein [Polyangiaceae bacterium]